MGAPSALSRGPHGRVALVTVARRRRPWILRPWSDQRHRRRTADAPPTPSAGSAKCRPRPEGHDEAAALTTLCPSHSASRDVYDSQSPNRARRRHRVWATERTQTRCVVLLRAAAASRPPAATIEDLGDPASGQSASRTPRRGVRR